MFDIQKEIDLCAANGGGVVTVPAGNYHSGTVYLRSNVTLHLAKDAVICGSENPDDYPAVQDKFCDGADQERGRALILAENVSNCAIEGDGIISGSSKAFAPGSGKYDMRPMLLRFVNSSNIRLTDIHLRDSAAWTCHLRGCEKVKIERINIFCHTNHNNDGIDVDSCSDVEITSCQIDSGDDAVCLKSTLDRPCENILIHACRLRSEAATFKIGTETYGDIRHVVFRNNTIVDGEMGAIKIFSADGANVSDIEISNIEITSATNPLFIRLGARGRVYSDCPAKNCGSIRNIRIDGLHGNIRHHALPIRAAHLPGKQTPEFSHNCISLMGLPDKALENIQLDNIDLTFPGGADEPAWETIPERADGYPELGYYGILPASCFYGRHVKNLQTGRITSRLAAADCRQKNFFTDVN
ncbi:MAG: hypothetical protein E7058_06660 [Lentisphaerae bacterium]|nr:hypothetical protein [Lentisphaerota bacterium]